MKAKKAEKIPYDTWHSVHRTKTHPDELKKEKTMATDYKWRTLSATGLKRLWKRYVACKFDADNPKCKHLNDDYDNVFDTWLGKQNYTIIIDENGKLLKCDKNEKKCIEITDKDEGTTKPIVAGGTRRSKRRRTRRR